MSAPHTDAWIERARAVAIDQVLRERGIRLRGLNGNLEGPCPSCGGTDRFAVNLRNPAFNCRQCGGKGGDAIELIRFVDGSDFTAR